MSALKRKSSSTGLQRRVRARREPDENIASIASEQSQNEEVADGEGSNASNSTDEEDEDEEDEEVRFPTSYAIERCQFPILVRIFGGRRSRCSSNNILWRISKSSSYPQ